MTNTEIWPLTFGHVYFIVIHRRITRSMTKQPIRAESGASQHKHIIRPPTYIQSHRRLTFGKRKRNIMKPGDDNWMLSKRCHVTGLLRANTIGTTHEKHPEKPRSHTCVCVCYISLNINGILYRIEMYLFSASIDLSQFRFSMLYNDNVLFNFKTFC